MGRRRGRRIFGGGGSRPLQNPARGLEYDIPFTSVSPLNDLLNGLLLPTSGLASVGVAWGAGDANAPRIWLGAYNTVDRLALVGATVAGSTPWVDSSGAPIPTEQYATGAGRRTATTVPVLATEDIVYIGVMRGVVSTVQNYFFATFNAIRGILVYQAGGNMCLALQDDGCFFIQTVIRLSPHHG